MTGPVARRYRHDHDDRDPLAVAVAAVARWLSDQRLDLQWIATPNADNDTSAS